ncbi:hypothetical protein RhiirA5_507575 [Rhizophagus irregularis]|uniref:Uncharacterized protein n=1 Tax=Rhizophagus irregularis TaxID=588596 RepID=A0A2N0NIY5_9GLOM|nr:hypothetical protein RhiirA5_507575 [Rhizophagus irregularis]
MRKKLDQASSSSQSAIVESDTVKIATGCKVIKFSADGELLSIIWTANPKMDLEIVVDTGQPPFSSYTFPKMKALFGLKADDYNELPTFVGGEKKTPKEIRNLVTASIYGGEIKVYPQYEISGSQGKGLMYGIVSTAVD